MQIRSASSLLNSIHACMSHSSLPFGYKHSSENNRKWTVCKRLTRGEICNANVLKEVGIWSKGAGDGKEGEKISEKGLHFLSNQIAVNLNAGGNFSLLCVFICAQVASVSRETTTIKNKKIAIEVWYEMGKHVKMRWWNWSRGRLTSFTKPNQHPCWCCCHFLFSSMDPVLHMKTN